MPDNGGRFYSLKTHMKGEFPIITPYILNFDELTGFYVNHDFLSLMSPVYYYITYFQ